MFSINNAKTYLGTAAFALLTNCSAAPIQQPISGDDAGTSTLDARQPIDHPPTTPDQPAAVDVIQPRDVRRDTGTTDTFVADAGRDVPAMVDAATSTPTLRIQMPTPIVNFPGCDFVSGAFLTGSQAYIVCPGDGSATRNQIFTYNTSTSSTATAAMPWAIRTMTADYAFANSAMLLNDRWVVISATHAVVSGRNGVYVTSTTPPSSPTSINTAFFPFPSGSTTPGDIIDIGDTLYVTAGNFTGTSYRPGQIIAYPINRSATSPSQVLGSATAITPPSCTNATGLTDWPRTGGDQLVILCTGDYNNTPHNAALLVYNPATRTFATPHSFPTDMIASTHVRVTGDTAVVGSSTRIGTDVPPDGRFLTINLNSDTTPSPSRIDGDRFHAGIEVVGGVGLLANFAGNITAFNISDPARRFTLRTAPGTSGIGPSLQIDSNCLDYYGFNNGVRVCVGM